MRNINNLALITTLMAVTTGVMVAREQSGPGGPPGPAPGIPAPQTGFGWDQFAGDLTIRHQRLAADGRPEGIRPSEVVLRLERRRVSGSWRTTLDVASIEPTSVHSPTGRQSLHNPFALSRLEFDDDEGAVRMYDRRGQLVNGPIREDIQALGVPAELRNRDWEPEQLIARSPRVPGPAGAGGPAAAFLSLASERASRRAALERRYGQPVGQVRGLDRFLSQTPDFLQELLVDPETALPVEINVADSSQLVSHATIEYETFAGTALLRRRIRNEQVVAASNGTRLVTEIELTNVRVTEGGR